MPKIFAFCNQKGGVGKTTSVVNISSVLASSKFKILIVDIDPQGNATSGFGVDKSKLGHSSYDMLVDDVEASYCISTCYSDKLDIIPALPNLAGGEIELVNVIGREFQLRDRLMPVLGNYDVIFIDCPPSLGLLTLNALTTADILIIPLQCEFYALEGLGQLLSTYKLVKARLNPKLEIGGVILTMADMRTNLTAQVIEDVNNHLPERTFKTVIPRSVKLSEAPSYGKPAVVYAENSKGAISYVQLTKEFVTRFSLVPGKVAEKGHAESLRGDLESKHLESSKGTAECLSGAPAESGNEEGGVS